MRKIFIVFVLALLAATALAGVLSGCATMPGSTYTARYPLRAGIPAGLLGCK
jgi:hypothetical protein